MTDKLRACPFCAETQLNVTAGFVSCPFCDTEGPSKIYSKAWQAIKRWNTRPLEDALAAQLAQAQEEVERMRAALKQYANPDNWSKDVFEGDDGFTLVDIVWEGGEKEHPSEIARRALEQPGADGDERVSGGDGDGNGSRGGENDYGFNIPCLYQS